MERQSPLFISFFLLILGLLFAGNLPANGQDTSAPAIAPNAMKLDQTAINPAQVLPPNLAQKSSVTQLRPGLYHVNQEVLRELRTNTPPSTAGTDTTRIYTATLASGVQTVRTQPSDDRPATAAASAADVPGQSADRTRYLFPVEAVAVTRSGVSGYYRPFIETPGGGLDLSRENRRFQGTLYLGVVDTLNPTGQRPLPQPIDFQVAAEGADVNPSKLQIRHTHVPFEEVRIAAEQVRDSIRLTIWSSLVPSAMTVPIAIRRSQISIQSVPARSIPGFGLGTAQLTVQLDRLGSDTVTVGIQSVKGRPRPEKLYVTGHPETQAEIRSTGMGTDTITASAPGFLTGRTTIRYSFPLSFLLATLLGGLAGAGLRYVQATSGSASRRLLREIIGGLLAALVVGVASTVGVNLLGVSFSAQYGEALFFTIAALGAYGWESIRLGAAAG